MPYSKAHKEQSRRRILESAARLFTTKGFDKTSIDEIMAHAKLTRGAFYAHFDNKSALYSQAMLFAASNRLLAWPKPEGVPEKDLVNQILQGYLSLAHVHQEEIPCPAAFLVTDVANNDPQVRKTYTKIFRGMNKILTKYTKAFSPCSADAILAITAMMIGGVAIGRALDDPKTTEKLLQGCRQAAKTLLESGPPKQATGQSKKKPRIIRG